MEDGEGQVVNDSIVVVVAMGVKFDTNREALETQVEILALCTLGSGDR